MPFYLNGDGSCRELDWKQDQAEITALNAAGATCYPTIAGAVIHGGVRATAFDRAVIAEPVYDGREALFRPAGTPLPPPVGVVSRYRVCAWNGELLHPPRHPSDLPAC